MEYIERIEEKLKEMGITAKKMLLELGYSDSLISTWKKGSEPSAIKLNRIAKYIQSDIEYILNGDNKIKKIGIQEYLTNDESEALSYFRKLPYRDQLVEIGELKVKAQIAEKEIENDENKKSSNTDTELAEEITPPADANAG